MNERSPAKDSLVDEILRLKKARRGLILAHYYEDGEVQDIADFVGDSLALSQFGAAADNPLLLMAGVVFMAESVKLLSPDKIVIVPDPNAGCSLVDHSPYADYLKWRLQYPEAVMVTYINSSVEVKSLSDVICTSSNAEMILKAIPQDKEILFGPDRNLGNYLAKKVGRPMKLWPGACQVHVLFSAKRLFELKLRHPNARVIAHPECGEGILSQSDLVGSTSRLLEELKLSPATEFIVATEDGIFHQMKKLRPDAKLIQAPAEGSCACNQCPYMKLNTLEKIRNSLADLKYQVNIDPEISLRARRPLQRMMDLSINPIWI